MVSFELFAEKAKTFCSFWITADFFAVGLFAFGGVAVRIGIQNALDGKAEEDPIHNYGPFMQMFHSQTYLLCNMVGCFVMSFLIAHTTQISTKSAPLYKGLTTGFCGSLTTFSSWMNGCVNILWDRYWYKHLLTILIEFYLTWAAFTMGYACAKMVDSAYEYMFDNSAASAEAVPLGSAGNTAGATANITANPHTGTPSALLNTPSDEHKQRILNDDENIHISDKELSNLNIERENQLDNYEMIEFGACDDNTVNESTTVTNSVRKRPAVSTHNDNNNAAENKLTNTTDTTSNTTREHWILHRFHLYEYYIWGILLATTCITIWITLGLLPYINYYNTIKLRNTYRAIALAPLGAWTRWGLTRFPGIKNIWPDMHPQTFIANIAGVTFMCALLVYSTSSWVYAVDTGFNGSLTTVSTFFAELHSLYLEKGPYVSLRYCLTTFFVAIAIIQILRAGNEH